MVLFPTPRWLRRRGIYGVRRWGATPPGRGGVRNERGVPPPHGSRRPVARADRRANRPVTRYRTSALRHQSLAQRQWLREVAGQRLVDAADQEQSKNDQERAGGPAQARGKSAQRSHDGG